MQISFNHYKIILFENVLETSKELWQRLRGLISSTSAVQINVLVKNYFIVQGSISSTFYVQLLHPTDPKSKKKY